MEKRDLLSKELKKTLNTINKVFDENRGNIDEEVQLRLYELHDKYYEIVNKLNVLSCKLIIGDDVVDLYKRYDDYYEGEYIICIHDSDTTVGHIDYRSGDWNMGNIGYSIYEEYRGNNYAYHAVYLLLNVLALNDVNETIISVDIDNNASCRVMDKLKKDIIECDVIRDDDFGILKYHYKFDKKMFSNNHKR